jgi:hypothetical protein
LRNSLAELSLDALWGVAELRFSFRDDAPVDWVVGANLQRRIAIELTSYDELHSKPIPPLPATPFGYTGQGALAAFNYLQLRRVGIPSYFLPAQPHPQRGLWNQLARLELWALFETILNAAADACHEVDDCRQVECDLLDIAVKEPLAKVMR